MTSQESSSSKEMAQKWSQTANSYVRYFEPTTLVLGRFMFNTMKLQFQEKPLTILEAGAGAGGAAKELLTNLNGLSLQHLYVTDLADGMLDKARERLSALDNDSKDKVTIEQADFTKFKYADQTFDRYYANMCLHYAEDPDVVLKECYRVLKPGGLACFSIWGRPEDSPCMTTVPDVLDELGLDKKDPNKRTSFHMGQDDVALRNKFMKEMGFTKCTVMHYPGAIECLDPDAFVELIIDGAASTKKQVESFSADDQAKVREMVRQRAQAILEAGSPMMLDMIVIVAQK